MPDTPDKGTEQAADTGGTTATASQGDASGAKAPDVDALQKQLAEVTLARETAEAATKTIEGRYGNAVRKMNAQGQELGRYREILRDTTGQEVVEDTSQAGQPGAADTALTRSSWAMLAQEIDGTPKEKSALKVRVNEFLADEANSSAFDRGDPYLTFKAVVKHFDDDVRDGELKELREFKNKHEQARTDLAAGAIVSGGGSSTPQHSVSAQEIEGMSVEEMEKKFGKEALLGGLLAKR